MLQHRYNDVITRLPHTDAPASNTMPGFVQIPESEYRAIQAQTAALTGEIFLLKEQMQNSQAQSAQDFEKLTSLLQQFVLQNKPDTHQTGDINNSTASKTFLFADAASFPFPMQSTRQTPKTYQDTIALLMFAAIMYKSLKMLVSACRQISKQKSEKMLNYIQLCIILYIGGTWGWVGSGSACFIANRLRKAGMSEKNSCIIGNMTGLVINLGFFSHVDSTREVNVKRNPLSSFSVLN